jgi:ribonucleoside-diphosphate reductase subunit M2
MSVAIETPSKVAANALSSINLNTLKPVEGSLLAKLKEVTADKVITVPEVLPVTKEENVEAYRKRFVGDVDCEEKDEPLLQETTSRFVLFPIKYREVSRATSTINVIADTF